VRVAPKGVTHRFDWLRLAIFGLLGLTCALLFVALTNAGWCMPALHAAATFATAAGTWWLARDDLALEGSGAIGRLVLTGVSVGLALTWSCAIIGALLDAAGGASWTQGELPMVFRHFLEMTASHWTPLGLVSAFIGTGLALMLNQLDGGAPST
jgi:hypothetical protein